MLQLLMTNEENMQPRNHLLQTEHAEIILDPLVTGGARSATFDCYTDVGLLKGQLAARH